MSMRASLVEAMHLQADSDTVHRINESGLAVADQETMSQAIHDVYCGIMADHQAQRQGPGPGPGDDRRAPPARDGADRVLRPGPRASLFRTPYVTCRAV